MLRKNYMHQDRKNVLNDGICILKYILIHVFTRINICPKLLTMGLNEA